MIVTVLVAAAALSMTAAMPASAATEIGSTFDPGTSSCGNLLLQSASPPADTYAAPTAGVITSWSYQANASEIPVQLQLKVGRLAGANQFTIVGESAVETASQLPLNSFLTRISVQAGDLIGLRPVTDGMPCIRGMSPGYSYSAYVMGDDLSPGTTATFNPPAPDVQLDIAANLESDGDGDGFGDETQDRCIGVPGPMEGCPSNAFTFGKVKRNEDRGTAVLTVNVPGPGELTGSGKGVSAARDRPVQQGGGRCGQRAAADQGEGEEEAKAERKRQGQGHAEDHLHSHRRHLRYAVPEAEAEAGPQGLRTIFSASRWS